MQDVTRLAEHQAAGGARLPADRDALAASILKVVEARSRVGDLGLGAVLEQQEVDWLDQVGGDGLGASGQARARDPAAEIMADDLRLAGGAGVCGKIGVSNGS